MICVAIVCVLGVCLLVGIGFFFRFHPQNVNEVVALARFINHSELEDLGNNLIEENLRASLPSTRFRREQRKRALLLFEYVRRMAFNSWVLLSWAYQLQDRLESLPLPDSDSRRSVADALAIGTSFRIHILMTLSKLFCRILLYRLRIGPAPKLADSLRVRKRSAISEYDALITVAIRLAGTENPEAQIRLATTLLGKLG